MDRSIAESIGYQLKGTSKESLDKIVGDTKLMADGVAEREAGKAQNAVGSARDEARGVLESKAAAINTGEKTEAMINTPER